VEAAKECVGGWQMPGLAPPPQSQPAQSPQFACILAVTKNRRGNAWGANGYCIAALELAKDGASRLVRVVPNVGTFWLEDVLPKEVKKMQRGNSLGTIRYDVGVLPDSVLYPHRADDVVANTLEYAGPVSDDSDLLQRLAELALPSLSAVWPDSAWATPLSLYAGLRVASLALFRGRIDRVIPREQGSPAVDLCISNVVLERIPYAAHRMYADRGVAVLWQKKNLNTCILLLGLARATVFGGLPDGDDVAECAVMLLGAFPA